jgi:hypothetical protein
MRVEQLGAGIPELAIVGAIHGDEPCGVRAIERLLADAPDVERPVKLIVANEEALELGVRYVDADLNRSFDRADAEPREDEPHEHALARRLADEVEGTTTLAIHSTQSHSEPFGIVDGTAEPVPSICPFLSIVALVDLDQTVEGRPFALAADMVEVEAGIQGSEAAAENAYRLAREFLTATGALPGRTVGRDLPVYRLGQPIEKPLAGGYEVFVENFSRVGAGQPYAAADGEEFAAEEPFYPVLMSAGGYESIFGYTGERIGALAAPSGERQSA